MLDGGCALRINSRGHIDSEAQTADAAQRAEALRVIQLPSRTFVMGRLPITLVPWGISLPGEIANLAERCQVFYKHSSCPRRTTIN